MIRRILLASAALITASGAVLAADLPARTRAPVPYAAPVFTWTGFYIGGNVGAAFANSNNNRLTAIGGPGAPYTDNTIYGNSNSTGLTGGGQIGYNWQVSAFVLGIEADINYRNTGRPSYATGAAVAPYYVGVGTGKDSNYFGTVRGRLGFAVDRALFFVTGGFAYGGNRGSTTASYVPVAPGVAVPYTNNSNGSSTGYTLGGGIEYAVTPNWTVKAEYLYVDLGKRGSTLLPTVAGGGGPASIVTGNRGDRFSVARVGFNYKF